MIVGFVGFQGSGKNTAALILEELGYQPISFADTLKDCLAAIFSWERDMLSGNTPESRIWREQVDVWWANKLGIPNFTPRMAMQNVGTETFRRHFNEEIWVASVEKKLDMRPDSNFVVTDIRYPNEVSMVRNRNGQVYRVRNGPEPEWFDLAERCNVMGVSFSTYYPSIHETEYAWIGLPTDGIIENDSTVEDLHQKVKRLVKITN